MKVRHILVAAALAMMLAAHAPSQQGQDPALSKTVEKMQKAVARLDYTIDNELVGARQGSGLAICIDAKNGTFVTNDVPTRVQRQDLKDFALTPAGKVEERIEVEFLGYDPQTGLSFLKAPKGDWTALRFEDKTNLQIGQRVVSVGLLGPNAGNAPYMGSAVVGARLRLPHYLVMVTGGELTVRTSPVATPDGRVVGIVGGEQPTESQIRVGGRWSSVFIMGNQWTRFFVPADEFAHVLNDIPTPSKPKRLAWTGILSLKEVTPEAEALYKELGGRAAVMVDRIVPNSPAAKGGVLPADTIVGFGGKPLTKLPTPRLTLEKFMRTLRRVKPGQTITLTIRRKGKESDYQVLTEPAPMEPFEAPRYYNKDLGLAIRDLVMLDKQGLPGKPPPDSGGFVFAVMPNSPAARELAPGDVVTMINDKPVHSAEKIKAVLDPISKPGALMPITFMVFRNDQYHKVIVTPPERPRGG